MIISKIYTTRERVHHPAGEPATSELATPARRNVGLGSQLLAHSTSYRENEELWRFVTSHLLTVSITVSELTSGIAN